MLMIADNFVPCLPLSLIGNPKSIFTFTSIENERNDLWIANTTNSRSSSSSSNNWMCLKRERETKSKGIHTHTRVQRERDSQQINKWASKKYGIFRIRIHIASDSVQPPSNEIFSSLTNVSIRVQTILFYTLFFFGFLFFLFHRLCVRVRVCVYSLASDIGVDSKFNHYISTLRLCHENTFCMDRLCSVSVYLRLSLSLSPFLLLPLLLSLSKCISLPFCFSLPLSRSQSSCPKVVFILFLLHLAGKWRRKCIYTKYTYIHTHSIVFRYME